MIHKKSVMTYGYHDKATDLLMGLVHVPCIHGRPAPCSQYGGDPKAKVEGSLTEDRALVTSTWSSAMAFESH